jgi:cell division protein ZapE
MFSPAMLKGGYRKKYFRALSRLVALANAGSKLTR